MHRADACEAAESKEARGNKTQKPRITRLLGVVPMDRLETLFLASTAVERAVVLILHVVVHCAHPVRPLVARLALDPARVDVRRPARKWEGMGKEFTEGGAENKKDEETWVEIGL